SLAARFRSPSARVRSRDNQDNEKMRVRDARPPVRVAIAEQCPRPFLLLSDERGCGHGRTNKVLHSAGKPAHMPAQIADHGRPLDPLGELPFLHFPMDRPLRSNEINRVRAEKDRTPPCLWLDEFGGSLFRAETSLLATHR